MLDKRKIEESYNDYKKWASKYITENNFELALESLKIACQLAHEYYIRLYDEDIENMVYNIGRAICKSNLTNSDLMNRFILYDSIAIDNMALTQQYLRALISWDVEFLYILDDEEKLKNSKDIIKEVHSYKNAEIFIVPSNLSLVDKIKIINNRISEYKAHKAFLHLDVADVIGVSIWSNIDNINRYLINHADHAFWIGINCSNYIISFRSMGINSSISFRNSEMSKMLMQPFYPIIQDLPFEGLPKISDEKVIRLFSGGRYFKIYGENGEFMEMMKYILLHNPNTILYFAGSGNEKPLVNFIKQHNLEDRWIVLPYRKDLVQVLNNIDIYIGTFPMSGGLMSNYAAYCEKAIIERDPMNGIYVEDLLPKLSPLVSVTFNNMDQYYNEIEELINNNEYRNNKGYILSKALITPEEFNVELKNLIENHKNKYNIDYRNLNLENMCVQAISTENNYLHNYPRLMLNRIAFRKSKIKFIVCFLTYIRYHGINKILKKAVHLLLKNTQFKEKISA